MNSAVAIANLLYRYAEAIDGGDLVAAADLFARAEVRLAGDRRVQGSAPMLALWQQNVRIHPCGTPRTKHVISNPIIEVDEAAGTANCRSYYTVFQATPALPLQPICSGRYHDTFARDGDGTWHFATRDYSLLDLIGDLSDHLLTPSGR
ncbi:nuclear transport factor 2 family protein [Nocardioides sp. Bht2]|uniref:nuclear transport factor 2 family protein n=1 Tax=Nocardioides sp. Bht2 TaxID=3392297 RepID=UPI0039B43649